MQSLRLASSRSHRPGTEAWRVRHESDLRPLLSLCPVHFFFLKKGNKTKEASFETSATFVKSIRRDFRGNSQILQVALRVYCAEIPSVSSWLYSEKKEHRLGWVVFEGNSLCGHSLSWYRFPGSVLCSRAIWEFVFTLASLYVALSGINDCYNDTHFR